MKNENNIRKKNYFSNEKESFIIIYFNIKNKENRPVLYEFDNIQTILKDSFKISR